MIDLNTYHALLDWIIILSLPIEICAMVYVYNRFVESEYKEKLLKYALYVIVSFHCSFAIRAVNHLFIDSEIIRTMDLVMILVGCIFALIFSHNMYNFSKDFGFNVNETTKKLRDWVKNF